MPEYVATTEQYAAWWGIVRTHSLALRNIRSDIFLVLRELVSVGIMSDDEAGRLDKNLAFVVDKLEDVIGDLHDKFGKGQ